MKTTILRILAGLAGLLVLLVSIVAVRTAMLESHQPAADEIDVPELRAGAPERLAKAVRHRTISPEKYDEAELEPFRRLHASLEKWFPRTHGTLKRERVSPCSLLYRWEGRHPDRKPAIFLGHLDVVPIEARSQWTHPPFSGRIEGGYIWGRGAIDVKSGVIGILEATETLLEEGFQPNRTLLYAFGCDEEVGGARGAKTIATLLERRDVRASFVLDEGHYIAKGLVPGLQRPVAMVGIAEKGYLTLELGAKGKGGHSAIPPRSSSIGVLADAIRELENQPLPARLNEPTRRMFQTLAPELPLHMRAAFANLWFAEPVVLGILTGKRTTNATVRTTTAVTMARAGTRENVLPESATATVNFRIAPGETITDVKRHVREVVGEEIEIEDPPRHFESNPSPVASTEGEVWKALGENVRGVFGEKTLVAPALTLGATDSRYYTPVAENVYRFLPVVLGDGDAERIHGVDERLSVSNYRKIVRFYMAMIRDA